MKKILFILGVIVSTHTNAQYLSTAIANTGIDVGVGAIVDKIDLAFGIKFPMINLESPVIYSATIGRMILLSNKEDDNYSITPSVGIANYRVRDFSKYAIDPYKEYTQVSTVKAIYKLELGKDAYMGRVFVKAIYCNDVYYEIGMRVFLKR